MITYIQIELRKGQTKRLGLSPGTYLLTYSFSGAAHPSSLDTSVVGGSLTFKPIDGSFMPHISVDYENYPTVASFSDSIVFRQERIHLGEDSDTIISEGDPYVGDVYGTLSLVAHRIGD